MPKPPFFTGFEAALNFRSSPVSRSRNPIFYRFFYYSKQIVSNIVSNTERGCPDGVLKVEKTERSYFFAFFKADMTLIITDIYDSMQGKYKAFSSAANINPRQSALRVQSGTSNLAQTKAWQKATKRTDGIDYMYGFNKNNLCIC